MIMYRIYMNSSMTALIYTSSGEMETLECNGLRWDVPHTEQTTSYTGKLSWITEAFFLLVNHQFIWTISFLVIKLSLLK